MSNIVDAFKKKPKRNTWISLLAMLGMIGCLILVNRTDPAIAAETDDPTDEQGDEQVADIVPGMFEAIGIEYLFHPKNAVMEVASVEAQEPDLEISPKEEEEESEYANLAVARVDHYVNVRSGAGTDYDVVGKMYDGSVAEILGQSEEADGLWFFVESGSVRGYIKAEFFVYGESLLDDIDQYIQTYAVVQVSCLNVRKEAAVDSERVSFVTSGEKLSVAENLGEWLLVHYNGDKTGYVAAEYVVVWEEYISAKSLEEEQAELAVRQEQEKRERQEREQALAQAASQSGEDTADSDVAETSNTAEDITYTPTTLNESYSSNSELRRALVEYAKQYVGTRYVHGGQSLSSGTDCSGFSCYVYRDFGYSISRTPSGQYSSAGRSISLEEAQPGDIICYGNSSCSHVGIYIGDGQIVHEANSKKGCIVSSVDYMNILGVRNIID
ncbi:MAG: C40 family peptidase [Lachnospiraceae bacterium]|nr:C40 family peptidase [Lachnospiraceae bacterium]